MGCGEALLGSKSTQPASALWEDLAAPASLLEDQSCIQGLATGTTDGMLRSGSLVLSPWGGEGSGTSQHTSGLLISSPKVMRLDNMVPKILGHLQSVSLQETSGSPEPYGNVQGWLSIPATPCP